jgi:uncharacterized membrane protein
MSENWAVRAFWFLVIFFIMGTIFTLILDSIAQTSYNTMTGFLIGLVGAAAFVGVAIKK